MNIGFTVRLRPTAPWRIGPSSGAAARVDSLYRSDALFSAITGAMKHLGLLEEWLDATARNESGSAVRFSSCFPFTGDTDLIVPPRTLWPPPSSGKLRWKGARFVPVSVAAGLLASQSLDDDAFFIDGPSEALLPVGRAGPFRVAVRHSAAVDRITGQAEPHSIACLEFAHAAGLWCRVAFFDDAAAGKWTAPLKAAFRLLADSGFGGERSNGWGRAAAPEFSEPEALLASFDGPSNQHWLLGVYIPSSRDAVDWARGSYSAIMRGGRVESPVRPGEAKKLVRMIEEGSVLVAPAPLEGSAADVAPENFPHPVHRAGFAFAIPLVQQVNA